MIGGCSSGLASSICSSEMGALSSLDTSERGSVSSGVGAKNGEQGLAE